MLVFIQKQYPENFACLIRGILESYNGIACKMFVYKYTETIEYIKNEPTFEEKYKLYG